jgi:hypothetical protein
MVSNGGVRAVALVPGVYRVEIGRGFEPAMRRPSRSKWARRSPPTSLHIQKRSETTVTAETAVPELTGRPDREPPGLPLPNRPASSLYWRRA